MKVSNPEATALDLLRYPRYAGGLNNIAVVLAELAEKLDPHKLAATAKRSDDMPVAQRLGFLLEHIGQGQETASLAEWIKGSRVRAIRLRANGPLRGHKSKAWKLIVNEDIEAPK